MAYKSETKIFLHTAQSKIIKKFIKKMPIVTHHHLVYVIGLSVDVAVHEHSTKEISIPLRMMHG